MIFTVHQCPACGRSHKVTRARAEMVYGRQLCCSLDCEGKRPPTGACAVPRVWMS